mmetsp:Transcript_11621/g.17342  ORF Transcript_11621/g.17342 Transcript_11621/m.17342 type:complete len:305 (-) Transcript_11621:181-1095(-)
MNSVLIRNQALKNSVLFKYTPLLRGMATEKQILGRINATKNISKITKSMKMVSAAKLRGDQERLMAARPFYKWTESLTGPPILLDDLDVNNLAPHTLIVPITSDRGLCGGINSTITRGLKKLEIKMKAQGKDLTLLILGEKGRAQLSRALGPSCDRSCTEIDIPYTFATSSALSSEILKTPGVDAVCIIYNSFRSAIAYDTTVKTIFNMASAEEEPMVEYEFEPDTKSEVLQDMYEYTLATQLYHSLMENATSEQSSRMNAMENASKNAGEMIDSLTLLYNRARQSRITTELIEIISGAAALEN